MAEMRSRLGSILAPLAVLTLCLTAGCGGEKESPAPPPVRHDPATLAALKAVPEADPIATLPAWQALLKGERIAPAIRPCENTPPAHPLAPGAFELPCPFAAHPVDRMAWDIPLRANLTEVEGLAFDFWCGDVTQFTGFSFYFKSGPGWYTADFYPAAERQWHRLVLPKARAKPLGNPAGWQAIEAVRLAGWRGDTNDTALAVANFAFALPPEKKTPEALAAAERADRAWAARQEARAGEWRAFWCHSPLGLGGGRSWRDTARLVKESGFNALVVNLAWAGIAFYPSRVLPVSPTVSRQGDRLAQCQEACRAHGLACHVWKVCWNLGHFVPKDFQARLVAAGRTQTAFDGTPKPTWLCPSDPDNLAGEIRACAELAQRGVDGIHLDYIRYPDEQHCFCAGCRRRFAHLCPVVITNWPAQVRYDPVARAAWQKFRRENITALVRGVAAHVRKIAPQARLSAAVFQNPAADARTIGQDWAEWCKAGYLDFVCPMNYNYDSPVAFKCATFLQKRALAGTPARLYPGIGLSAWSDRTQDIRRTVGEILVVREAGLDGFIIFNLDARAERLMNVLHAGPTK